MKQRALALILAGMTLTLAGCGSKNSVYSSIQLEQPLTTQEVLDYYAKELSYESITQYNILDSTKLEFNEVKGVMKDKVTSAYREVVNDYKKSSGYSMTEYQHEYLKYVIDDMVLNEKSIVGIKEAMGYYYIEVSYDTAENQVGSFKNTANYLGIDGVIIRDYSSKTVVDNKYLESAIKSVNSYKKSLGEKLLTIDGVESGDETEIDNQVGITGSLTSCDNVRKLDYDVGVFNEVVGSSKAQIAFMPTVSYVYNTVAERGTMSGYGIFDAGNYGLRDFGYLRNNTTGSLNVTYVFKQDELNESKLSYLLCYINSYKNNNLLKEYTETIKEEDGTEKIVSTETTVPGFVKTELDIVIERLDRAICNRDISALMSNQIVEDAGIGVMYGMYGENSQIVTLTSNINKVIDRNNNVYLVELERTVEDAAKGTGVTSIYKDTYYAVIRQDDLMFKVNDLVMISRELVRAPEPNPDNAAYRRLVALNLSGPISTENKDSIDASLNALYEASTNRKLEDMYARFNRDTKLLDEEKLEYLNSRLRGYLTAKGISQKAIMSGQVTSWIGGYDTQAELTTEELIEYEGTDTATYIECYYLMSNYGTDWVIDDIEIMSETEIAGEELSKIKERIAK